MLANRKEAVLSLFGINTKKKCKPGLCHADKINYRNCLNLFMFLKFI